MNNALGTAVRRAAAVLILIILVAVGWVYIQNEQEARGAAAKQAAQEAKWAANPCSKVPNEAERQDCAIWGFDKYQQERVKRGALPGVRASGVWDEIDPTTPPQNNFRQDALWERVIKARDKALQQAGQDPLFHKLTRHEVLAAVDCLPDVRGEARLKQMIDVYDAEARMTLRHSVSSEMRNYVTCFQSERVDDNRDACSNMSLTSPSPDEVCKKIALEAAPEVVANRPRSKRLFFSPHRDKEFRPPLSVSAMARCEKIDPALREVEECPGYQLAAAPRASKNCPSYSIAPQAILHPPTAADLADQKNIDPALREIECPE
jgi:hypothetical protein